MVCAGLDGAAEKESVIDASEGEIRRLALSHVSARYDDFSSVLCDEGKGARDQAASSGEIVEEN